MKTSAADYVWIFSVVIVIFFSLEAARYLMHHNHEKILLLCQNMKVSNICSKNHFKALQQTKYNTDILSTYNCYNGQHVANPADTEQH